MSLSQEQGRLGPPSGYWSRITLSRGLLPLCSAGTGNRTERQDAACGTPDQMQGSAVGGYRAYRQVWKRLGGCVERPKRQHALGGFDPVVGPYIPRQTQTLRFLHGGKVGHWGSVSQAASELVARLPPHQEQPICQSSACLHRRCINFQLRAKQECRSTYQLATNLYGL